MKVVLTIVIALTVANSVNADLGHRRHYGSNHQKGPVQKGEEPRDFQPDEDRGAYVTPPPVGVEVSESGAFGIEGPSLHIPAMSLRLPSLQLPSLLRFRRRPHMVVEQSHAPFMEGNIARGEFDIDRDIDGNGDRGGGPQQFPTQKQQSHCHGASYRGGGVVHPNRQPAQTHFFHGGGRNPAPGFMPPLNQSLPTASFHGGQVAPRYTQPFATVSYRSDGFASAGNRLESPVNHRTSSYPHPPTVPVNLSNGSGAISMPPAVHTHRLPGIEPERNLAMQHQLEKIEQVIRDLQVAQRTGQTHYDPNVVRLDHVTNVVEPQPLDDAVQTRKQGLPYFAAALANSRLLEVLIGSVLGFAVSVGFWQISKRRV